MNKCDIEEVKGQARQKFLELAKEPDLWKPDLYPYYAHWQGTLFDWKITTYIYYLGTAAELKTYILRLDDELIETTSDQCADISVAITKIMEWHAEKAAQKRRLELQEAMQKSCQKIQQAMSAPVKAPKKTLLERLLNLLPFVRSNSEKNRI